MRRNVGLIALLAGAAALAVWLVARETHTRAADASPAAAGSAGEHSRTELPASSSAPVELQRPSDPEPAPPRDVDPSTVAKPPPIADEAPGLRSFQQVPTLVEITETRKGEPVTASLPEEDAAFEARDGKLTKAERATRLDVLRIERARAASDDARRALDAEIRWLEAHPGG